MKKLLVLLLVLAMSFSLCACGKSEAVLAVEEQIAALTEVTLEDQSAVTEARAAFDALPEEEQEDVKNYHLLHQAELAIRDLLERQEQEMKIRANEILAANDAHGALIELRELPQTEYVRQRRYILANQMLLYYLRLEGYRSDSIGGAEADGDYLTVAVQVYNEDYYFSTEYDNSGLHQMLEFTKDESYPTNPLATDEYTLYNRSTTLRNFVGSEFLSWGNVYYTKAEHFKGSFGSGIYFDVSLYAQFAQGQNVPNLSQMPVELEISNIKYWPYTEDKHDMEEYITADVEDLVEEMNDCLEALGLPMTAWEVLGIFE